MLSYEKLIVYQKSILFFQEMTTVIKDLPRANSSLVDQLKRASMSISLNIAEASGKTKVFDKKRFFAIARGSAMECGACLDICYHLNTIDKAKHVESKQLLKEIVAMLSKLSR